ncbi:MAG: Gfo/Idh/MocA family oxidoreductase [Clostridiales bacterium]|jgi:predicted dehydrogenase|nr:Gfo/Idh/MocA family oxidoreductase [Clostridiales bacterium]
MKDKVSVVVVGYGGMGGFHADELSKLDGFDLLGVYDIKEERNELARKKGYCAYDSFEAVLADERVELITIAAYNDVHKELAVAAMEAGKNVISEKPVTLSSVDLEEMIAASERTGRLFTVHQNRRWDDDYLTAKNILDKNTLGKVFSIESKVHGSRGIPGDWRAEKQHGGGMVLDWGVHLLDQMLTMTGGRKIISVYASLTNVTNSEVDDGFSSFLRFDDGMTALVEVCTNNFISMPRWYMLGENGSAVINNWELDGEIVMVSDWENRDAVPIRAGAGLTKTMAPRTDDTIKKYPLEKVKASWADFYGNIYDVLRNGAQQLITHDQLRRSMKLMEAIFESAAKNETIRLEL